MNIHEKYMKIAINLAKKAEGRTSPNPIVGAVIVKNNKIIGKGYHERAGLPHAEIKALNNAREGVKGATMYVTLEPCDHFGRTPPCTDAVIRSGIKKVVIGMKDPNPVNNGRGIKRLKMGGIETQSGVMEKECADMNAPYIKFIKKGLPSITIKLAESIDGKIATRSGDSKWITSRLSRKYVQRLRSSSDAVMVGFNTVLKDDPMLLTKGMERQPVRIALDSALKTPLSSKLISSARGGRVIIVSSPGIPMARIMRYEEKGVEILTMKSKGGRIDLKSLLRYLAGIGILSILVEGGGELAASLIEEGLADKFIFFIAPKIIGGRSAVPSVGGEGTFKVRDAVLLKNLLVRKIGEDILIEGEAK